MKFFIGISFFKGKRMLNIFNNLNQLYTFYLVASLGSFSRAADKLCVTEPAVSIQIRSLEQSIGFKLLERAPKQISLTEKGKVVYQYAERLAMVVSELSQYINQVTRYELPALAVGTTKSLAARLLPRLVTVYLKRRKNVSLRLDEYSSQELLKGLIEGRYEIAISGRIPYDNKLIEHIHFTDDLIYPIVWKGSDLLGRHVSINELSKEPMIVRERGSAARYNTIEKLQELGFKPRVVVESGSTEFIKELVKEKKGYTFLPWFCITEELERGEFEVIDLPEVSLVLPIDILYLKGRELSEPARDFISFLKEIRRSLLTDTLTNLMKM